ncbi:MAG: methyltransferase domain-containing protein [bacterium]
MMTRRTPLGRTQGERDLDSPRSTIEHRALIQSKLFLRLFYERVYAYFLEELMDVPGGALIELGSGGGFIKQAIPEMRTSDVLDLPELDARISATALPFREESISGICLLDVFHHIPNVARFLKEAERVLRPGGKVVMWEPANTPFARFLYQNFHHEPFDPNQREWQLAKGGPLSMANGALPWIVCARDAIQREQACPTLVLERMDAVCPLLYLFSGGVSQRQLLPDRFYSLVALLERLLSPWNGYVGMFYKIRFKKV